jgi:hypothetical protein
MAAVHLGVPLLCARENKAAMYDVIARTACVILTGICLAGFLLGEAFSSGLPVHRAFSGRSPLRRVCFFVAVLFFLMLVIEWASQHHRTQ